jgi:hypothetical protein
MQHAEKVGTPTPPYHLLMPLFFAITLNMHALAHRNPAI